MWYNNRTIVATHSKNGSRQAWAIFNGIPGWKRVRGTSVDGVTNLYLILCTGKANNRKVDVYLKDNYIEQATLR